MAGEVRSVVLKRGPEGGFGFSILGGSGSELPPIVYDIVAGSPASNSGQLEAGDVILEVNDQEVSDLTTKEVLKCLRLSEQSVSLKLRKDDAVRQRVSQYLQSPQTLEQLRPAITQRDLAHVRESVFSLCPHNEFSRAVAEEYVKHFDFSGCSLDVALGQFLERFSLTGETQERERVLVHFSRRYMDGNPAAFNSVDACHTLTCALMLLNTDLHVQHVPRKMTCAEFVDNLSELNDGRDFPEETLRRLYQAIRARPIHYAADDEYEEMEAAPATGLPPGGGVTNPFLAAPDPDKATEYKRGYMMRKCCLDAGGKRTALGRRSWQMFHCTLRDLVLYLHKDESGSRRAAAFEHLHNAIRVHHALASKCVHTAAVCFRVHHALASKCVHTAAVCFRVHHALASKCVHTAAVCFRVHHALASKAEDYVKKQHVFKLQTADQAEYLLQTSDAKELQSWVDTVNFVAASLSSPPLPGAVGSQRRFQRPLLPSGVTSRSLHYQPVQCHGPAVRTRTAL
ncbi:PH and SEC7 domain-containing protein 4 [Amphibalanus amphitrite]|uniref:PH and SEC7 domain-containing protein 4 n=1 Tax=Amphibalanus amphitrite TaxID=1232801 RepID=A0A6A4VDT0_AMPAM|nr:PH and SEC7 domain-containing protein 4 [Amphibalanus amphitrite]